MFSIDSATAVETAPAVPAVGPNPSGFFTNGNPGAGVPATIVPDWWLNMVQAELEAPVLAAGETPSKTNNAQLLAAINSLIATAIGNFNLQTLRNTTSGAPATVTYNFTPSVSGTLSIIAQGGSTGGSGGIGNIMTETGLPSGYGSQQHTVSDGSVNTYMASVMLVAGTAYTIILTQTAGSGATSNGFTAVFNFVPNS